MVPEIGECGLVDAVRAVPEVDRVQVGGQDSLLRPLLLELPGEGCLAQLPRDRALVPAVGVLDELLRDRRATLDDALLADVRPDRSPDRPDVDAAVLEVTAVLDRHDRLLHDRRDVVVVDDDAVLVPAQDCQDLLPGRVVDLRVHLVPLLRRVELGDLARDRGDEPERERRQRQDEEGEREDQQAELPDPAPLLRRRRFSAAAKTQDPGSVVSVRDGGREADTERRRRPPRGWPRAEARQGPAAARQARDRRHVAGHPRRPRDSAPANAGVSGRGTHGRADHRRLHDPDRRSVGPFGGAPDPLRRGDRPERQDVPGAGDGRARSRPDRGALQRRVAVEAQLRRGGEARTDDHRGADARARRLRQALSRRASRSRSPSSSTR